MPPVWRCLIPESAWLDIGAKLGSLFASVSGWVSRKSCQLPEACLDVLSDVLRRVRLHGAVFYNAEFSAPWALRSPPAPVLAPYLAPDSGHVIIFHLLTEGLGYAHLEGERQAVPLRAGDLVVFPHGDSHVLGNGARTKPLDAGRQLQTILSNGLKLARFGGGGETTKFICGYMACDPQLSRIFLGGLPRILKVPIRDDSSGQWLENSLRYSVRHSDASLPGSEAVLARLSETLFVEMLRRYIGTLPRHQTGWLAGVRDPQTGKALALLHRQPGRRWTVASLASQAGTSRSVLAERFRRYLGETPIGYLTKWRLQLGAQLLKETSGSVAEIAAEVGYQSEPSFNRAFKRQFGVPPARFRNASRSGTPARAQPAGR